MPAMREARNRRLSSESDGHEYMRSQASRLFGSDNEMPERSQVNRLLSSSDTEQNSVNGLHVNRLLNSDSELQLKGHVNRLLGSTDGQIQMKSRNYMMSPMKVGTKADGFERKGQAWFVATELQSDLVVEVGDITFNLHKFPLLSRSGHLNRLVFESRDTQKDHIRLTDIPGGPEAFELAAKFCYGVAVDLTANCIAALRSAAEYLEMTEDLEDGNLISKTEAFLSFVVLASWKDSITVLQSCESLSPWAENLQIVRRCTESIAWKACTDPKGISWSFTGRGGLDNGNNNHTGSNAGTNHVRESPLWNGLKNDLKKIVPHDWWVEDVSSLCVQYFVKVITAIRSKGMRSDLVGAAVVQYALKWIPGLDKEDPNSDASPLNDQNLANDKDAFANLQSKNRLMLESLVTILPSQKDSLTCSFLLRMLRIANMLNASIMCRKELERRVGAQLDQASLTDLLIPSYNHTNETLFDVDLVHRVVENFLMQEQASPLVNVNMMMSSYNGGGVEQRGGGGGAMSSQNAKIKVAKLIDSYLAEVARDANLSVAKFQALAEELPEYARTCDDGLYRAIDTYLKAHPATSEVDRKKLCRLMDCQKLSLDACMHAAQNERLPLRVVVQVLFCEQVKLRNAITGSALSHRPPLPHPAAPFQNSPATIAGDGDEDTASAADSPWSVARRDIRLLKLDVEQMKARYAELQADYMALQRQLEHCSSNTNSKNVINNPPNPRRMSGVGFPANWGSGLKKLVRAPGHLFHQRPSRFSIDDSTSVSGAVVAPPAHLQRPPRRWRNSIS
ncbi:hypothetical protein GOP47_0004110 [Adiantum capillus-veneris]|uniref:Uncharacterized protein n=1 Tax=Adiantum capillus-veneris TaxID=13818 RepID=A0A9D4V7I6_ADICA|nr:hypothetical protein GOP47_0004110 [Adiantum capillus-veneris]